MTLDQMAALQERHGHRRRRRSGTSSPASTSPPTELQALPRRGARSTPTGRAPHRGAGRRRARRAAASPTDRKSTRRKAFGQILNAHRARATASSAAASSRPRPTSRSRPTSAPGSNRRGLFGRTEAEDVFRELERSCRPQLWRQTPHGPAHRARHRREQPVPPARRARPRAPAVRRAPAADRHALRSVHRARPRCAELRLLPGCALHAGGDAVGHHAGARGRRAPVDRHAADRHRPAGPRLATSRPTSTSWRC